MTERETDKVFLNHTLESIRQIEYYLAGFDQEMFNDIIAIQDSVIRRFEIIGEALNRLSPNFRR